MQSHTLLIRVKVRSTSVTTPVTSKPWVSRGDWCQHCAGRGGGFGWRSLTSHTTIVHCLQTLADGTEALACIAIASAEGTSQNAGGKASCQYKGWKMHGGGTDC